MMSTLNKEAAKRVVEPFKTGFKCAGGVDENDLANYVLYFGPAYAKTKVVPDPGLIKLKKLTAEELEILAALRTKIAKDIEKDEKKIDAMQKEWDDAIKDSEYVRPDDEKKAKEDDEGENYSMVQIPDFRVAVERHLWNFMKVVQENYVYANLKDKLKGKFTYTEEQFSEALHSKVRCFNICRLSINLARLASASKVLKINWLDKSKTEIRDSSIQDKLISEQKLIRALESSIEKASVYFQEGIFDKKAFTKLTTDVKSFIDDAEKMVNLNHWLQAYDYNGFDADNMIVFLASKNHDPAKFVEEMVQLIGLFIHRGPNTTVIMAKSKATSTEKDLLKRLLKRYNVSTSAANPENVTLPRIAMIFPNLTWSIHKSVASVNYVLEVIDIGDVPPMFGLTYAAALVSFTDLASDISTKAMVTFLITGCSAMMTRKIKQDKLLTGEHLANAIKYQYLSSTLSKAERKDTDAEFQEAASIKHVATLMYKLLVKSQCKAVWEPVISGFHQMMNELSRAPHDYLDADAILLALQEKSLVTMKEKIKACVTDSKKAKSDDKA